MLGMKGDSPMCKKKQFRYCPSEVDECMKTFIPLLNLCLAENHKTVACCCGHGRYPMTLLVRSNKVVIDLFSGEIIPRKRNFYKKDKKGYHYIPEVSKEKK